MSKYNKYAQDLDKAFKKAREAYKEEVKLLNIAERFAGKGNTNAERIASQERYNTTKSEVRRSTNKIWQDFSREAQAIREALREEIERDNMADPRAVDANALELMKTGVLTPTEYKKIAGTFKDNPTMQKLLAFYANKQAQECADDKTKVEYSIIASEIRQAPNAVLQRFDAMITSADYCSGHGTQGKYNNSSYVLSMADKWEEFNGNAINEF